MAMPVLATKLYVPPPRSEFVPRPRLIEQLDRGLASGRKATLLSAPAGFGKTSLLAEWIAHIRRRDPAARVAWLSLDDGDNDPARFLAYLVAALHAADPTVGSGDDGALSAERTLTGAINDVAVSPQRMLLILDDFHVIGDASVRDAVVFLLDHLPPVMHVVICTRSDPLLPLARLRVGDELTELRSADLRFTPDEAASFLTRAMGLALTPEHITALETRTEGWIAGLQLAALSMRSNTDVSGFIDEFAGSNRFVMDYLMEEVLDRTPSHVADFLRQTAILRRLSGPLCDAVTGRNDSAELLDGLERANLFTVSLDDRREWYRYHHLFADVLRTQAQTPVGVLDLHRRASEWLEHHDFLDEAVWHAFEGTDLPRAARLIEAAIPGVRKSRQDATVLGWLAALPDEAIARRPVLLVFSAWASIVRGDIRFVDERLDEAERLLGSDDGTPDHDSEPGGELTALSVTIELYRASLSLAAGDLAGMRLHAQRALDRTAPDDHFGRGAAAGLLGLASWAGGDLGEGVAAFGESATNLRLAGNLTDALSTTMVMADMLLPLGRLREARRLYEQALRQAAGNGTGGQPAADLHAGIGDVLRETNELELARDHLAASTELGAGALSHEHRYRWFVAMARIHEADGNLDLALESLERAEQHYRRGFSPDVRPIGGMRARIHITQGRLPEARAWVEGQDLAPDDDPGYLREFGHVTLARLLIAEHQETVALKLLDRLLVAAEAGARMGVVAEILLLRALALHEFGENAIVPLERALSLAEPEGHLRLFLDEGERMLALLRSAAGAGIRSEFVRVLSRELRGAADVAGAPSPPLSERELHVLRLLATELSGPEIARELFVSLNTLRTHTKHIFTKLDANSRAAAVRRAESLGLI